MFKYILVLINLGLQIKIPSKIYLYHKIPPRSKLPGQTLWNLYYLSPKATIQITQTQIVFFIHCILRSELSCKFTNILLRNKFMNRYLENNYYLHCKSRNLKKRKKVYIFLWISKYLLRRSQRWEVVKGGTAPLEP